MLFALTKHGVARLLYVNTNGRVTKKGNKNKAKHFNSVTHLPCAIDDVYITFESINCPILPEIVAGKCLQVVYCEVEDAELS